MNSKSLKRWQSLFEKLGFFQRHKTKRAIISEIVYGSPLPIDGYYMYAEEGLIYEFEYSPAYEHLVDRLRGEGWHIRLCVKFGGRLRYRVIYS